jgi:small subunit ribosomal protein S2e
MAEAGGGAEQQQRGGFRRGFGRDRDGGEDGGRGRGRGRGGRGRGGRGRGRGRGGRGDGEKEVWNPVTKLGRLVKAGKIQSLEEVFLFSMPIKEAEIVDHFLGSALKDEVMKIVPVQKQTQAGQRTKFKAWVAVGDNNGHFGLGCKVAKEVATAIRGAITAAKIAVVPVRRGWWGTRFGAPHTVPMKVTGKCGSCKLRIVPAPRGAGIVAALCVKKILAMAGLQDVYTQSGGKTKTMGNFLFAAFYAMAATSGYLTPDLWKKTEFTKQIVQAHSDWLKDNKIKPAAKYD